MAFPIQLTLTSRVRAMEFIFGSPYIHTSTGKADPGQYFKAAG